MTEILVPKMHRIGSEGWAEIIELRADVFFANCSGRAPAHKPGEHLALRLEEVHFTSTRSVHLNSFVAFVLGHQY